ncbi:MAG TPA: chorismate synthase [Thermoplasmata archaeon]|nr:chorismate synthase [Thermoplasmata archaeon]
MMSYGRAFRVTVFGSSHGPEVGVGIEGVAAGIRVAPEAIQADLDRRRPVGRRLSTRRKEEDRLVVDSGLVDGTTDGTPIRLHVANTDVRRAPYEALRDTPRPGHADYPARVRFGSATDLSGGGIFSGRMTVGLVAAGAVARGLLASQKMEVAAHTTSIGGIRARRVPDLPPAEIARRSRLNEVGAIDPSDAVGMVRRIGEARRAGDSVGGVVECATAGVPVGVGEPFFDSLESELAHLAFSIPGVRGIEFGTGFAAAELPGSDHNDGFYWEGDRVVTRTNHAGGILGGLSNGQPIVFRVAFKPTPSIARPQFTVNLATHRDVRIGVKGRHDPCIVPRAIVVVEAITWIALAELMLRGGFVR